MAYDKTIVVTKDHLTSIYETLCSASFWLSAPTIEGNRVKKSIIAELRRLEDLLEIPEGDRLRSDVE